MENKFLKLTNTVYKVLEFFPESDPLKNRAKDKALAIMDHLVSINETSGWASFQKEKIKAQLSEDIDALLGYLWIGKSQGWLNSVNYLITVNEYEKIKKETGPAIEMTLKLPNIEKIASSSAHKVGETGEPRSNEAFGREPKIPSLPVLNNTETKVSNSFISNNPETITIQDKTEISDRQKQILEFLGKNDKAQVMDLQKVLPSITKRTIRRDLYELIRSGKITKSGDFNQVFYKIKG